MATTTEPIDAALIKLAQDYGVQSYAGSSEDVLDRYFQAAALTGADVVMRITADDPFKDPEVMDLIAEKYFADSALDYASNTLEPSYPEGLDIEIFSFAALEIAWREAQLPSEREHVTPYIWKNPEKFKLLSIKQQEKLSHLRWTIDYDRDLEFAREVYARLYKGGIFGMKDILRLLEQEPKLAKINAGIERNAGYIKSLAKDRS